MKKWQVCFNIYNTGINKYSKEEFDKIEKDYLKRLYQGNAEDYIDYLIFYSVRNESYQIVFRFWKEVEIEEKKSLFKKIGEVLFG